MKVALLLIFRVYRATFREVSIVEQVMVVALQDQWDVTTIVGDTSLQEAQRGSIRITASPDRELEMVARVIPSRVRGKTTSWTMLKALVYWQDHHLPSATQATGID